MLDMQDIPAVRPEAHFHILGEGHSSVTINGDL
jgi:hypothetical protein